jgi:hypothetical protein
MTAKDRVIIQHAKRIIKLEKDIALVNARVRALEARPVYIQVVPLTHPPAVVNIPPAPWPNYPIPGVGDYPFNPNTCSGSVTSAKTDGLQVRQ